MVNDLLNLSRLQTGRLKYNLSDFSISDTISEVIGLLSPLAQKKKLKLQIGEVVNANVQADRDKIEEIFDNLIGNSLKFTDKGGITVSTSIADNKVKIIISDTGIGITKEDQARIFGQFQQLESGQLRRPAGTGLGLHISRAMVRRMGGELWIEKSEIGKGSTFSFSLPIAKSKLAIKVKEEIEMESKSHAEKKHEKKPVDLIVRS